MTQPLTLIEQGVSVIRDTLKTLSHIPGVYRMLGEDGSVLYVGKAKSLKNRVVSYTRIDQLPHRLRRMVSQTRAMEIVITDTETEALLLESNLIKKLQPRYNILLKDDKAFPFILLTSHDYPKVMKYRGQRKPQDGTFFGPFASAASVDDMVLNLQKVFLLRNCSDDVFKNRRRPCLQYHIKRCSAPCVGYITKDMYAESVKQATDFLKGKNNEVQAFLSEKMQAASDAMAYEEAALYRDRIKLLTHIQTHQRINVVGVYNADVIAITSMRTQTGDATEMMKSSDLDKVCVQVFFFRHGSNYGTQSFFMDHESDALEENLSAFLKQFYHGREPAPQILLSHKPDDLHAIQDALSASYSHLKIKLSVPRTGERLNLVTHAARNAKDALLRRLSKSSESKKLFEEMARLFHMEEPPTRIEAYDNSHLFGRDAYGVMVVATLDGMDKKSYRKFKIDEKDGAVMYAQGVSSGGDDYAMMRHVMMRRFRDRGDDNWTQPDLLLIDGGKGHVRAVCDVLRERGLTHIAVVGISKGEQRNAGRETFVIPKDEGSYETFQLPHHHPLLHLLQRMRDEAHRFGIESHRAKRIKNLKKSMLDDIPGIGPKRKKALLLHFGSAENVRRAALKDLMNVPGIDASVAHVIFEYFN